MEGASAETHDAFRGMSGAFARTIDAIRWANEISLPVQINTTFSRRNIDEIDAIVALIESLNITLWSRRVRCHRQETQTLRPPGPFLDRRAHCALLLNPPVASPSFSLLNQFSVNCVHHSLQTIVGAQFLIDMVQMISERLQADVERLCYFCRVLPCGEEPQDTYFLLRQ